MSENFIIREKYMTSYNDLTINISGKFHLYIFLSSEKRKKFIYQ